MKQLLAFRHVHFENLGFFHRYFESKGFGIEYVEVGIVDLEQVNPLDPDLIVILGGPIGAYEDESYPYLSEELALIRTRLDACKPILGFCLGAQLIARALGASVYPGPATEIGWITLNITNEGLESPVKHLNGNLTNMFHWHGDTFDLPVGAKRLASTDDCLNQIFSFGDSCLAFQCHPEVDITKIESWLIGHAFELAENNIDVFDLRYESMEFGPALKRQGVQCIDEWLKGVQW